MSLAQVVSSRSVSGFQNASLSLLAANPTNQGIISERNQSSPNFQGKSIHVSEKSVGWILGERVLRPSMNVVGRMFTSLSGRVSSLVQPISSVFERISSLIPSLPGAYAMESRCVDRRCSSQNIESETRQIVKAIALVKDESITSIRLTLHSRTEIFSRVIEGRNLLHFHELATRFSTDCPVTTPESVSRWFQNAIQITYEILGDSLFSEARVVRVAEVSGSRLLAADTGAVAEVTYSSGERVVSEEVATFLSGIMGGVRVASAIRRYIG